MLLGRLDASLLSKILASKRVIRSGEGFIRAGSGSSSKRSSSKFLIPPHPLTNYEIEAYYQNESRFNRIAFSGVFNRYNLP